VQLQLAQSSRESIVCLGAQQPQARESTMAFVHREQGDAAKHEAQPQRQAVVVVHAGQQHDEQQHTGAHARLGGQNIDAARVQCQRQAILALSRACPALHSRAKAPYAL
jgi:hypothetical protein